MSDSTISGLPVISPSAGLFTIIDNGMTTGKITLANLAAWMLTQGGGTFSLTTGKIFTVTNTVTLSGTDSTVMTFPTTSATLARIDAGQTFTGTQIFGAITATAVNGNTITPGTGVLTLAAAKTLTVSNTLTLAGTDGTTMTFPATSSTVVTLASGGAFTAPIDTTATTLTVAAAIAAGHAVQKAQLIPANVIGIATGDGSSTAAGVAGQIGEFVASGNTAFTITTSLASLTAISLTAGDWDVEVQLTCGSGGTNSYMRFGMSTTSGAFTGQTYGTHYGDIPFNTVAQVGAGSFKARVSLGSTTTIYLVALVGAATITGAVGGIIQARRAR